MKIVEGGIKDESPTTVCGEMSRWRVFWNRAVLEVWHWRLKRWIPRLVWLDDEIDVRVTFKDIGALGGDVGRVWDADKCFHDMGIRFDAGSGHHGRDWEWDYSLAGPISVTFKGRARNPEKRMLKQRPKFKLVS